MVDSTNLPNVDINQIVTDLNNKLDRDCLNYSDTGYNFMAGASMPSNKYINLTLGASGSTYTAPADGFRSADGEPACGCARELHQRVDLPAHHFWHEECHLHSSSPAFSITSTGRTPSSPPKTARSPMW